MKIKAACIGTPDSVVQALSGTRFASMVLTHVVGIQLGVKDVLDRPAEYYVQFADVGPSPKDGLMGVEVRLTGVSRDNRTTEQFHLALQDLVLIVKSTIEDSLQVEKQCQIFCVIMIDREIEIIPGSGVYSSNLESKPMWVKGGNPSPT